MCWSAPVSLATFITSIIMCLYLWGRNLHNDRVLAIWIFWFALMQLFEFFMWSDMKNHSFVSKLAFINILLQPFILSALLIFFYRKEKLHTELEKFILFGIMAISLIKSLVGTFYAFITHKNNNWLSVKGPNCHLIWWFINNDNKIPSIASIDSFYIIPLLIAGALIKPFNQGLIYFLVAFISFILIKIFYVKETGSLWCWIANIAGIIAISMPYLKL